MPVITLPHTKPGHVRATPVKNNTALGYVELPTPLQVPAVGSINLEPTNEKWCWKLETVIYGVDETTEYVTVSPVDTAARDLIRVDPGSFTSSHYQPEPAWWAALRAGLKSATGEPGEDGKDGEAGEAGKDGFTNEQAVKLLNRADDAVARAETEANTAVGVVTQIRDNLATETDKAITRANIPGVVATSIGKAETVVAAAAAAVDANPKIADITANALLNKGSIGTETLSAITEPGFKHQTISANITVDNGYPPGEYRGWLLTLGDPKSNVLKTRIWIGGFTGKIWTQEKYNGGAWTPWKSDTQAVIRYPAGTPAETLRAPQIYAVTSGADSTGSGLPTTGHGLLKVSKVSDSAGGAILHEWTDATNGTTWTNYVYNNIWRGWKNTGGDVTKLEARVATLEKAPTSATPATHQREIRTFDMKDRAGKVLTANKGVVALVFDHSLEQFKTSVLPLLKRYGLKSTLAINAGQYEPGYMHAGTNGTTTWAEIAEWSKSGVEFANHGWTHRGATGVANIRKELIESADALETNLNTKIDTYVQIGIPAGDPDFDGFSTGKTYNAYWETEAGRMLMERYPVIMGTIQHPNQVYKKNGELPVGVYGRWIDDGLVASIDLIKERIQLAINTDSKFIVRCHAYALNSTLSIETLEAFLIYLKSKVDSGELVVTTMREWAIAE